MRPGVKPLPANVHRLRGNPSGLPASRLEKDGVNPPVKLPDPPTTLSREAKREWRRIGPELEALGLVSELDRATLAAYCQNWARWVEVERKIKELGDDGLVDQTPSGYKQISVYLQISNRCVESMHKAAALFGLAPSARVTLQPSQEQMNLFDDDSDGAKPSPARFFRR